MSTHENAPKPKPPASVKKQPEPAREPKKAYRPKPHLSHRPFSDDELLANLIKNTGVNEGDK